MIFCLLSHNLQMQQSGTASGPTVVLLSQPSQLGNFNAYSKMSKYLSRQMIGLGVAQMAIGVMCIVLKFVNLGMLVRAGCVVGDIPETGITFGIGIWASTTYVYLHSINLYIIITQSSSEVIVFLVLLLAWIGVTIPLFLSMHLIAWNL